MRKLIFVSCLFAFSTLAIAQTKKAIIFGGNCNDKDLGISAQELMTDDMLDNAKLLKKSNWETTVLHDTDSKIEKQGPAGQDQLIGSLQDAAANLKNGDQLLLTIQTHGRAPKPGSPHSICMNDYLALSMKNLDFRKALISAKEKGIKIGILTDACYGGAMVKEFAGLGCILSTQNDLFTATGRPSKKSLEAEALRYSHDPKFFKNYPESYQMGVTSEMSKILMKDDKGNLSDVYLSSLINYNVELTAPMKTSVRLTANFPQSSVHDTSSFSKSDELVGYASRLQELSYNGGMVINQNGHLKKTNDEHFRSQACTYSQLTDSLDDFIPTLENLQDNILFSEMLKKYAGPKATKFESLEDYISQYEENLKVYAALSKEYDATLKVWKDHSATANYDEPRTNKEKIQLQKTFDENDRLELKHDEARNKLIPIERKVVDNYNLWKAFDYYKQRKDDPCSTFSL